MPVSFVAFWKIFMLSLVGITLGFNIYGIALDYTSPTLAAAATNCLQPMTFFLAILLGMERVKLRTIGGVAKIVGIMLCMAGVVTLALYKGPYLNPILHHHLLHNTKQINDRYSGGQNWMKGCFLMFLSTLCWALWYVYQAPLLKECPSKLIFTSLQSIVSAIQTSAIAIAVERDISEWKLGWDIKLIAIVYSIKLYFGTMMGLGKKPYLLAILFQIINAGMFVLSKAALNEGINSFVFIFYRQLAGAIVLIAVVIFKRENPMPVSFVAFWKIFMLSLVGITLGFNIYGIALDYTSPTLAAAATNCLQPMTFFLAILLGMERVKLRTVGGVAKIVGIMLCMAGVVTLPLYKGPYLNPILHHHLLHNTKQINDRHSGGQNWMKGCFLMFLSTLCWALWYVYQVPLLKECPSKLIFTSLQSIVSAIQTGAIAIAVERDISKWKLGWDIKLIAIVYSGIIITAVGNNLMAWLLEKKGPVFHAMWTPLGLVITTLFSIILLGEGITLGSVVGGILLVGSLYCVLWGKDKEEKLKKLNNEGSSKDEVEQHC